MGKIAQFKYLGGSHPGNTRTVYIFDDNFSLVSNVATKAYDFELDEIRTFSPGKMTNFKWSNNPSDIYCDVNKLPSSFRIDEIVDSYKDDGRLAFYDSAAGMIVAIEPPVRTPGFSVYPSFTLANEVTKYTITVTNKNSYDISVIVKDSNGFGVVNQQLTSLSELADIIKRYA